MTKEDLRAQFLRRLRWQPPEKRLAKSRIIARRLRRLRLYQRARVVMCYVSFDAEVETGWILSQALLDGKRAVVPAIRRNSKRIFPTEILDCEMDLKSTGHLGIPQPRRRLQRRVPLKELGLVIVPGVAFDRRGNRLGRGGGYFDRFLSQLPARVPCIGVAFRFQVVKTLPVKSHDRPVAKLITETITVSPSRNGGFDSHSRGNDNRE